jgi:hypothetical protein
MYWASAASLLFLTVYRLLSVYIDRKDTPKKQVRQMH